MIVSLHTLGKKERLKSRKRIDALFSGGRKMQQSPFRLLYLVHKKTTDDPGTFPVQTGFTASSRNFPRAVDRNRLKRLMRETYRVQKAPLEEAALRTGCVIDLFVIYTGRDIIDSAIIRNSLTALLIKLTGELK